MKHIGTGTQRVEEELRELFPGTEMLRMDADTVVRRATRRCCAQFEEKKVPILHRHPDGGQGAGL